MGTDIVNYKAAYAAAAEKGSKQDRGGDGTYFSTRGGILALGEEQMPGNQVACVIVDSILENAFYAGAYDPAVITPPTCYSLTRGEPDEMQPDLANMSLDQEYFMPQNMADDGNGGVIVGGCKGCPMNEFGSAMRNGQPGRGKACKNQYRLALLPAGLYQQAPNRRDWELGLHDEPAHYDSADVIWLKLPPTSGSYFEKYRKMLRMQHARPPFGAFTRIYLLNDPHKQFTVNFELIELVPNEVAGSIIARAQMLEAEPLKGYEAPKPEDKAPAAAPGHLSGGNIRRR